MSEPLFSKIDCMMLPVTDLGAALAFYRDKLGQPLAWRTDKAAAVLLGESELLLHVGDSREVDIKVDSAVAAAQRFVEAGGSIVAGPFDIKIGKCVVVKDPWGNELVLLDSTKGLLKTDEKGNVIS
jgi:predicted enzyme related to lactoylglutathione lyase